MGALQRPCKPCTEQAPADGDGQMGDRRRDCGLCTPAVLTEWALTGWRRNGEDEMKTFPRDHQLECNAAWKIRAPLKNSFFVWTKKTSRVAGGA